MRVRPCLAHDQLRYINRFELQIAAVTHKRDAVSELSACFKMQSTHGAEHVLRRNG